MTHSSPVLFIFFFFNDTATTEIYTLSLHDALPILNPPYNFHLLAGHGGLGDRIFLTDRLALRLEARAYYAPKSCCLSSTRSEEHTSELQSPCNLVCRLLLEKKKI